MTENPRTLEVLLLGFDPTIKNLILDQLNSMKVVHPFASLEFLAAATFREAQLDQVSASESPFAIFYNPNIVGPAAVADFDQQIVVEYDPQTGRLSDYQTFLELIAQIIIFGAEVRGDQVDLDLLNSTLN
jgi:hypothetical protein